MPAQPQQLQACFAVLAVTASIYALPALSDEPVGFDVAKRCVEASGGKEAFDAVKSIVMKGTIVVTANNASDAPVATGTLTTYFASPDRAKVVVDLKPFGKTEQGVRGKIGWEKGHAGVRRLSDTERTRMIDSISLRESFAPTSVFASITNRGTEIIEGEPCYRVEVKRHGRTDSDQIFYNIKSGLPARTMATRSIVGGSQVIESTILEYKSFEGLQIASRVRQIMNAMGVTHDVTIETVELNTDIADSVFDVPEFPSK
ncbi:outer membrane lipoprotein-sorting protein [Rubripirellula amarantea]|nr:outer membrane lipoprotein-sorting protein [Rubripirellula amarantea]